MALHVHASHGWYSDAVKKDQLSGGDWVSNFGNADGVAGYDLTIAKDGEYTLWVRANDGTAWGNWFGWSQATIA